MDKQVSEIKHVLRVIGEQGERAGEIEAYLKTAYFSEGWYLRDVFPVGRDPQNLTMLYVLVKYASE